jgi:hypothetical protein
MAQPKQQRNLVGKRASQLSEAAREERRRYMNRYRRENPERVRQWTERYWEKRALARTEAEEAQED